MNEKVIDKIRKLLALSINPNENEAKQALLKARELMAKYKISQTDVENKSEEEFEIRDTDISFTKTTGSWVSPLAHIISENYCCGSTITQGYGEKTCKVRFCGFTDDINVCERVFRYAYDFVINRIAELKKCYKRKGYTAVQIRKIYTSYGYGFCEGINKMFSEQNKENIENNGKCTETGIVLVVPKEVTDYTNGLEIFQNKAVELDTVAAFEERKKGIKDGKGFSPKHSIE